MSTAIDRGKQGPHPDLVTSVLTQVNSNALRDFRDVDRVIPSDVRVLQRRTLYGMRWSTNLWEQASVDEVETINVDVSVGLALVSPEGGRRQVLQYLATRRPHEDWGAPRMSVEWIEDPPTKPWASFPSLARGLGVAWGLVAHSPDLGKVRLSLEDGRVAESIVSNGTALMFLPFASAELWESVVTFGFYDTEGREILTQDLALDLTSLQKQS